MILWLKLCVASDVAAIRQASPVTADASISIKQNVTDIVDDDDDDDNGNDDDDDDEGNDDYDVVDDEGNDDNES